MSDNIHDREFLVYHQGSRSFLNVYRSTVATQDFLFIDPNCRCRKFDLSNRIVRGEEQDTSPGARCRERVSTESRMRHGHQYGIGSPPFGLGLYCIYKLTICWVKGLYRTKGETFGAALGDGIAGVEAGGLQPAHHQELQADGAAADYQDCFVRCYPSLLHGFDDGVDGLDEGGFFEGDIVRERDDAALGNPGHSFDVFAETAAVGREAAGEPRGLVLLALRIEALFAVEAGAAGRVVETHHAITGLPFGDAGADRDYRAGEFVAEDLRRLDVTLEDFFNVGAADAASGDFDEDFVDADFGDGDFFDADNSLFAVDAGAHGFGDGAESLQRFHYGAGTAHRAATSCNSAGGQPCELNDNFLMNASRK